MPSVRSSSALSEDSHADTAVPKTNVMEQIVSLCKRRGFIYPASEIYGGINGFWDYGPLGVLLKNNIRDWWWKQMVECPPIGPDGHPVDIVGLDSSIIQNPKTWIASGHVGGFSDPMVDDRETKQRYRADHAARFPCHLVELVLIGGEAALFVFDNLGDFDRLCGNDTVKPATKSDELAVVLGKAVANVVELVKHRLVLWA